MCVTHNFHNNFTRLISLYNALSVFRGSEQVKIRVFRFRNSAWWKSKSVKKHIDRYMMQNQILVNVTQFHPNLIHLTSTFCHSRYLRWCLCWLWITCDVMKPVSLLALHTSVALHLNQAHKETIPDSFMLCLTLSCTILVLYVEQQFNVVCLVTQLWKFPKIQVICVNKKNCAKLMNRKKEQSRLMTEIWRSFQKVHHHSSNRFELQKAMEFSAFNCLVYCRMWRIKVGWDRWIIKKR